MMQYCFFAFCAVAPVFCFRQRISLFIRVICYSLIILLPVGTPGVSDYEIFGKILNSGFLVYFASFSLLIYRMDHKDSLSSFSLAVLDTAIFLCPTTNPACYILVGVFFFIDVLSGLAGSPLKVKSFRALLSKRWFIHWLILGMFLTGTALYTVLCLTHTTQKAPYWEYNQVIIFLSRQIFYPFVFSVWSKFSITIAIIVMSVLLTAAIIRLICLFRRNENSICYFYLLTLLACVIFTLVTLIERPFLLRFTKDFVNTFPDRYHYAQNCMWLIFFSILLQPYSIRIFKIIPIILVFYLMVLYSLDPAWIFRLNECPVQGKFRDAVVFSFENNLHDSDGKGYLVPTSPRNWSIWLSKDQVFATLSRQRSFDPNLKEVEPSQLTNNHWSKGVNRKSPIVLFERSSANYLLLIHCSELVADGVTVPLKKVELKGRWIWALVDSFEDARAIAEATSVTVE